MNTINWYPGHKARARRLLSDQLSRTDLVLEICDARLPFSSRNPDLDSMLNGKRRILLMNKADLADPEMVNRWLVFFRSRGETALGIDCRRLKAEDMIRLIERETRETAERAAQRGYRKTIRAVVVGVPNVGKSTFINRLRGKGIAATGDKPGVTRSNQWVRISPWLELLDTPGLLWPRLEDQKAAQRLCYIGTVRDEIISQEELTILLLEDLAAVRPDSLKSRFRIENPALSGPELLDALCRGRGFLLKGGRLDYDRACAAVLDEFRAGKLGRVTMEIPPTEHDESAGMPHEKARTEGPGMPERTPTAEGEVDGFAENQPGTACTAADDI